MLTRIDTASLKRDHPIAEVIARYGVALRPSGRALVGRCPFHADGGRPNLHVYPGSESWYCYRCGVGGDAISFVERIERVDFRLACERLAGGGLGPVGARRPRRSYPRPHLSRLAVPGPDERACLAAAVELYHNALLGDARALAYVEGRGVDLGAARCFRLGYARGDELVSYLRWRRLPAGAARRVGLLGPDGREFLAGRVVVPEIRAGQPIWLIGRLIGDEPAEPRYLGLPGRKPLLGWEGVAGTPEILLTEGVFDLLTLRRWGYPALALVGTRPRPAQVEALRRFARIYLVLDADEAGREATLALRQALGERAVPVALPGVKDVAELALRPDGRLAFRRVLDGAYPLKAA